ncbi:MAG: homoserine kinase [Bacteroidetes bacterium]|jgi:homoserine kinase|nr:MAG: homoserine kinase [Cryomorphaceae bacterium BACL29 MAG-121220-bin8]MDA0758162.1 homoserine kinase [Bacteroidota bacterium]MDA1019516.1 homoserine kinase [Bacteroidota bacterium]|tara:strand:+ start:6496 stop:7425 length:930 start_codon:yes stop_codon:yes gene_type:complete
MKEIKIFSPASIANLSCGFDILGVCLNDIGDTIVVRKTSEKGIKILKVTGQKLNTDIYKNVAGVSALALLKETKVNCGFEIEIHKGIKPGSGIGSSAASSAGSVYAINELLGRPYSNKELIKFAIEGEKIASGSAHADNVAAVLLGGFTFVRDSLEFDIFKLNTPIELAFTILHPQIEVKTSESRAIIKNQVPLRKMIVQTANLGAFISGLYTEDYNLIGRSIKDVIIEPLRSILIPKFDKLKEISLSNGALGFGISGSGPSVFALSKGLLNAKKIGNLLKIEYNQLGIEFDIHTSSVNEKGIKIIEYK